MTKYRGIKTLEILEGADKYNKWIAESVMKYIKPPILEIGSGTGNLSSFFIKKRPIFLSDVDLHLIKHLKNKFLKKNNVFIEKIDVEKECSSKFRSKFFSVVGVNVLEHIKNDGVALKNVREYLKPGGKLILLVPAKKNIYTKLDKNLGHFRRYEKKELIQKIEKSGYDIEKIYFFNIVGLLSWIIRDKVEKENIHLGKKQIVLFNSIVPILRVLESFIKIPVGISLIVVARKNR